MDSKKEGPPARKALGKSNNADSVTHEVPDLLPQHAALIEASGIAPEVAKARGYFSVSNVAALKQLGFSRTQSKLVPALVIPLWDVRGKKALHQARPDRPRDSAEKPVKYETPHGVSMALDVHPLMRTRLGDPAQPLIVTEGARKADAATSRGMIAIGLLGVWNWRGTNGQGGKTVLPDWESVALNGRRVYLSFDSDIVQKREVQQAMERLAAFLSSRGADVYDATPPSANGAKVGLDDYLASGGDLDELLTNARSLGRTEAIYRSPMEQIAGITYSGAASPTSSATSPVQEFVDLDLRSDLGNARRLVAEHGADIRYAPRVGWLCWDGKRWAPDAEGEVMRRAKLSAMRLYRAVPELGLDSAEVKRLATFALLSTTARYLANTLEVAKTEIEVVVKPDQLDLAPGRLNVLNGTLEIATGGLHPHRREDLLTKLAPVKYVAGAHSSVWDEFLARVLPIPAVRCYFKKSAGYAILGEPREKDLFFLYGDTDTGKSTGLGAIEGVLGDEEYAQTADFETFLRKRGDRGIPNDLARMAGKRFVKSLEVDDGRELAEGILKALTGRDRIAARFLNKEFFEYLPQFVLFLAANARPKVKVDDNAMWGRIRMIPFTERIPESEQDKTLPDKLAEPEHQQAILAWLVEGAQEYLEHGLEPPPEVIESTNEYREENNMLAGWASDCALLDQREFASTKEINDSLASWWSEHGSGRPPESKDVAAGLRALGCVKARARHGSVRGWKNIRLKSLL